jgi:hypothetical protein
MNKIKSYKIVKSDNMHKLSERVIEEIMDGWQPLGGVCVIEIGRNNINWEFYQAIVQYSTDRV